MELSEFEQKRLSELYSLKILNTSNSDLRFDRYTKLASQMFSAPASVISLVDKSRQWFKSKVGVVDDETPRRVAFCSAAIKEKNILVVTDAKKDPRFSDNPSVTGHPHIRFYAGAVIRSPKGYPLGTICIVDDKPRNFEKSDKDLLKHIAKLVELEIQAHYKENKLKTQIEKQLSETLYVDPVTQLPNYRLLTDRLNQTIQLCKQHECSVTVCCLLLRKYKTVQTALGSDAIDHVLKKIISQLQTMFPEAVFGRWREDEFVIFMTSPKAEELDARRFGQDLLMGLDNLYSIKEEKHYIQFSIGLSQYPKDGRKAKSLIENASKALLYPPEKNHEGVHLYSKANTNLLTREMKVDSYLREAITRNELSVHYQPIVEIQSNKLIAGEALCRWNSKVLGKVSPDIFIKIAERSDLILELDLWVLRSACKFIRQIESPSANNTPYVSVNITEKTLRQPNFIQDLQQTLEEAGIAGNRLNLEITERVIITELEYVIKVMLECQNLGVTFSIDDYGTGHSSLRYLQLLPLRAIKIDKSFVEGICSNDSDSNIVKSTIAMAHALGLRVIAEGVETETQLDMLDTFRCDKAQGYLFGEAISSERFLQMAKNSDKSIVEIKELMM